MEWETKTVDSPRIEHEMRYEDVYLHVSDDEKQPRRNQYFGLSFVEFSAAPIDECLKTWPLRALILARKALDEFEAALNE